MNLQDYFRTIPHRPSFSHLRAIYEGITNERASGMTVFNRVDFDTFKRDAGTNAYAFSIKEWNDHLHGVGIISKSGRYGGGIFAQADIALEFASWLSPEFKLYIVKDYQRLKTDENSRLSLNWNLNREISKINYRIHTDAINGNLILPVVVGVHIGEDEDLLALKDVHPVVHTAPSARGQPVVLRDESGANEGRFLGLNQGHNPFRVAGEEMLAKQALYAFCS